MVGTVENRTIWEGSQTRMDTLHLFGAFEVQLELKKFKIQMEIDDLIHKLNES